MDPEDIAILAKAIQEECKEPLCVQLDEIYSQIIINPPDIRRCTRVVSIDGMHVAICAKPGYELRFNIAEPDSIPKIAKAIDHCIKQISCEECQDQRSMLGCFYP